MLVGVRECVGVLVGVLLGGGVGVTSTKPESIVTTWIGVLASVGWLMAIRGIAVAGTTGVLICQGVVGGGRVTSCTRRGPVSRIGLAALAQAEAATATNTITYAGNRLLHICCRLPSHFCQCAGSVSVIIAEGVGCAIGLNDL